MRPEKKSHLHEPCARDARRRVAVGLACSLFLFAGTAHAGELTETPAALPAGLLAPAASAVGESAPSRGSAVAATSDTAATALNRAPEEDAGSSSGTGASTTKLVENVANIANVVVDEADDATGGIVRAPPSPIGDAPRVTGSDGTNETGAEQGGVTRGAARLDASSRPAIAAVSRTPAFDAAAVLDFTIVARPAAAPGTAAEPVPAAPTDSVPAAPGGASESVAPAGSAVGGEHALVAALVGLAALGCARPLCRAADLLRRPAFVFALERPG